MRKFVVALVLLLGVVFVIAQFSEVRAIAETIQRGDWRYLLLALFVQAAWLLNVATSFRAIFRTIKIEETLKEMLLVASAAIFVSVVTPSIGMGGLAMFVSQARHRKYSAGKAAIAGALYVLFDYIGFFCVLALGLLVLVRRNNLTVAEITASVILVMIAAVLAFLLYLGTHSWEALGGALAWMARQVNRVVTLFTHKEYISEKRAYSFARGAAEGLKEVRSNPKNLLLPFLLALSNKALLLTIFFLVFMAFKVPLSIGTLIAGFSISYLFLVVSPTPSGIGIVEGVLTLTLSSMYVPLEAAAVVTLAYRGFTFWIPLLVGMVSFRHVGSGRVQEQPY